MKNLFISLGKNKIRSIVILLIILGIVQYFIKVNRPPEVEKATVQRGEIAKVIEASGKVQAKQLENLAFSLAGKVVWVGVKKGDAVSAYQVLATMDQREVEKNLKKKLLDYLKTRWDQEQLQDNSRVFGRKFEDVPTLTIAEKRILEKSQFGLDQSVLEVEIADLAREEYYLMTPIAGVVVDDGRMVAGERLNSTSLATKQMRIIDPDTLYFEANVDEADYAKVKIGQKATILLDSFSEKNFSGTVVFIGKEGVKKTGGSVQIPVDINFAVKPENLVPELNGDVEIIIWKKTEVLTLAKEFVHKEGDKFTVNILEKNKIVSKPVKIGTMGIEKYEILAGLQAGEEVVNQTKTK